MIYQSYIDGLPETEHIYQETQNKYVPDPALQAVVSEVWNTIIRQSLPRKLLSNVYLPEYAVGRVRINPNNNIYSINDRNEVCAVLPHQNTVTSYFYPHTFELLTALVEDEKPLLKTLPRDFSSKDFLERVRKHNLYKIILKKVMGQEENITKKLLIAAANMCTTFKKCTIGTLNKIFDRMIYYGLSPSNIFINMNMYREELVIDPDFSFIFDPVTSESLLYEGYLGCLYGKIQMYTDGYRHPELRILQSGEIFVTAAPSEIGVLNQHKSLHVVHDSGIVAQIQNQVIINANAVCYGVRD